MNALTPPASCSPPLPGFGSSTVEARGPIDAGGLWFPASPVTGNSGIHRFEAHGASRGNHGYFQRTIVGYTGLIIRRIEDFVLCCGLVLTPPASNPPALYLSVRGIPVRRPTPLPPASFRHALLHHPCPRLPFAFARLGMDFDRYLCQNIGHHQSASVPCPAHNQRLQLTFGS